MKRICTSGICVLVIIMFAGCNTHFDTLELPYRYGEARWVSESPDIWFDVHDIEKDEWYMYPEGKMKVEGKEISFVMSFPGGSRVFLDNLDGDVLVKGRCEYSPEKLIIHVSRSLSKYFVGETLEFNRTPKEDETAGKSETEQTGESELKIKTNKNKKQS